VQQYLLAIYVVGPYYHSVSGSGID